MTDSINVGARALLANIACVTPCANLAPPCATQGAATPVSYKPCTTQGFATPVSYKSCATLRNLARRRVLRHNVILRKLKIACAKPCANLEPPCATRGFQPCHVLTVKTNTET